MIMKKKSLTIISGLMIIGLLYSGCSSVKDEPKQTDKPLSLVYGPTPDLTKYKTFEDAGEKMVSSVVLGLSTQNYELYSRDFTDQNKKYFTKEIFKEASNAVKKELGDYQSIKYVGFWTKGGYNILLWKAKYSQTKDDILVQMYIKNENNTYKIAALKLM